MTTEHAQRFVTVLRAIAFAGTAASIPVVANCSRPAASGSNTAAPTTSCPASPPGSGTSCADHVVGHECEWYGAVRCLCQSGANTPAPQWSCVTRSAPGPMPPPESA